MSKFIAQRGEAVLAKATAEIVGLAAMDLTQTMQPGLDDQRRARSALYLNIVESLNACNILIRSGLDIHAAVQIRSMLESFVNMTLLKDPAHLQQMLFDKVDGDLKLSMTLLEDPHLPPESIKELQTRIAQATPEKKRLKELGYTGKNIAQSIRTAGLSFLSAPYVTLNSFAHWDLAALSDRYDTNDGHLQVFGETRAEVTFGLLWVAIQIMVMATDLVKDAARFEEGSYKLQFDKMNNAWGIFQSDVDRKFTN